MAMAGSGGAPSDEAPGIQYIGRWDRSDPNVATASWGPVGIRARFTGASVRVRIVDVANTFSLSIDGGQPKTIGPGLNGEVELASGLAAGEHLLELFRRSEGNYGKTAVSGLVLDSGEQLLPPPTRPQRKIEVVGDSISAGYGNEGMGGTTPLTQNGYAAFGPQLARLLGAEWSIIAHSGQGMYRNLCETMPPTAQHMPEEFLLTQHPAVPGSQWNFESWQPDVLLVALGTNDFSDYPPGSCQPPDLDGFQQAYAGFLGLARAKYPRAEIFAVGTFIATATNQFGTCNQTICAAVESVADPHVHCVDPSTGSDGFWLIGPDDYIGDWTHPTVAAHSKVAERLAAIIKPVLGW